MTTGRSFLGRKHAVSQELEENKPFLHQKCSAVRALPLFWKSSRSWPEDLAQPVRQARETSICLLAGASFSQELEENKPFLHQKRLEVLPLFWKESSSRSWPEDLAQPVRQAYDYWQELPWQETCCFART